MKVIRAILLIIIAAAAIKGLLRPLALDPVGKELQNFNNSVVVPISESLPDNEGIAKSASTSVMATRIEKEIIPTFEKDIVSLQKAHLKTKEVQKLRDMYVEGLKDQTNGYKILVSALRTASEDKMTTAAETVKAGKAKIQQARDLQESLVKKHKLKSE